VNTRTRRLGPTCACCSERPRSHRQVAVVVFCDQSVSPVGPVRPAMISAARGRYEAGRCDNASPSRWLIYPSSDRYRRGLDGAVAGSCARSETVERSRLLLPLYVFNPRDARGATGLGRAQSAGLNPEAWNLACCHLLPASPRASRKAGGISIVSHRPRRVPVSTRSIWVRASGIRDSG